MSINYRFYVVCFLILFLGIDCSGFKHCNFIFRSYQVQFYALIWVFFQICIKLIFLYLKSTILGQNS